MLIFKGWSVIGWYITSSNFLFLKNVLIASRVSYKQESSNIIYPPGWTLSYNSSKVSNVAEYASTSILNKAIFSIPEVGKVSLTNPFKNLIRSWSPKP
jgi:hypothetical protein